MTFYCVLKNSPTKLIILLIVFVGVRRDLQPPCREEEKKMQIFLTNDSSVCV